MNSCWPSDVRRYPAAVTQNLPKPDTERDDATHDAAARALGRQIRELRNVARLTIDEVAHRAGISRSSLGSIELGKTARSTELPANPGFWTVIRIARALEVPPGDLFREITGPDT